MAPAAQPWQSIFLPLPNNEAALEALQSPSQCLEDQSSEESKIMSQLLEILPPPADTQRLEDSKMWIHAELWAVLLGSVGNGSYNVIMMCVGKGGSSSREDVEELHKVGIFVLPTEIAGSTMFGISSRGLQHYKVGGFGPDLSAFVTINTRVEI